MIFLHLDEGDGREIMTVIKNSVIQGASVHEEDSNVILHVAYQKPFFDGSSNQEFVNEKFLLAGDVEPEAMQAELAELSKS